MVERMRLLSNIIKSGFIKSGNVFKLADKSEGKKIKSIDSQSETISEEEKEVLTSSEREKKEIVERAKAQAQKIVAQAQKEALDIKKKAQVSLEAEKDQVLKAAQEEGFNQGFNTGLVQGEKQVLDNFKDLLNNLATEVAEFKDELNGREESLKQDIVRLSIAISEKIIAKELLVDKDIVKEIINDTIKLLDGEEEIKIKVNPRDLESLAGFKEDLLEGNNGLESVKIVGDEGVRVGGTLIESDFGGLDATVSSQLEEVENRLLEVINDE